MIVPMKKVSLVVLEREREAALEKLREAGVVHLKKKNISTEIPLDLYIRQVKNRQAQGILNKYTVKKETPEPFMNFESAGAPTGEDFAEHVIAMVEEKELFRKQMAPLIEDRRRVEDWGDFEPSDFAYLGENNVNLYLYKFPSQIFRRMVNKTDFIIVFQDKRWVKALAVGEKIPGMEPFAPPEYSLSEISSQIDSLYHRIGNIDDKLAELAQHKGILETESNKILEEIEYVIARDGMETPADVPEEISITGLSGFVPDDKIAILINLAVENCWTLAWDDPGTEDRPPTILRNRPAVRIIQPLFSMLGTLPGYWEYDISMSYMFFLCIFFAMILGDAVYGIIIFTIGFTIGLISKKKNGQFPDAAKLLMLLATCTIVWGCISGSWSAIPASRLPRVLRMLIIPPLNDTGPLAEFPLFLRKIFNLPEKVPVDKMKTQWNIQFLCFTIGMFQLVWARGKNIRKELPSLTALAQTGWLVIVIGIYFIVLFILLRIALPSFVIWLIAGGFTLNIVFSEQRGGNFLKNIGKSFSNIIPIILKTIGCFGDIVSYIRLFAVGMAGSIIVQTINSMAIPQEGLGSFGLTFILRLFSTLLILVFAHSLHLAINALSVIVHGLRLNLLEYAGNHLDIGWSGYKYNPFAFRQMK